MQEPQLQICPRCNDRFLCQADNITACQCSGIQLSEDQRQYIAACFSSCLCSNCLQEIKNSYPQLKQ